MSAPERPIRVGIIGCGNVALEDHVPAYLSTRDRYRLVAIADPTPDRLELGRAATGLGPGDCHADPGALVARDDVDLVDVCTPQRFHHDLVMAAVASGRHVLSEKPLATTPRDAWEMVAAAEAAGVTLAVMHNYLLFPEVARTLEILASGEIGPVEVVILNWLGVPDLPGNVAYRPAWRHDPAAAGGGVLMDMLHIVYLAEAMLGAPIERVSAWVTARAHGAPVEDIAVCRFETAEAAALVNVGWGVGMGGYAISGSQGRIEVAYRAGSNGGWEPVERFQVHGRNGITEVTNVPFVDGAQPLLVDLADAIRDSRPPIASGAQGAHILEATLAAYASAATGRTWSLPLVAGEPLYERGVAGLREFDLDPSSTVARKRIFGVA